MGSCKSGVVWLWLLCCAAAPAPAWAAEAELEHRLRAAFLINFVRFVSWAPEQFSSFDSAIDLCVTVADPIAPALEELVRGKSIGAHPLRVRRFKPGVVSDGCHLVYIAAAASPQAAAVFDTLMGRPVLTIHESGQPLPGGVIRLFVEDRKLRFEVNTAAVDQGAIKLGSQLMSLAALARSPP